MYSEMGQDCMPNTLESNLAGSDVLQKVNNTIRSALLYYSWRTSVYYVVQKNYTLNQNNVESTE